MGAGTTSTWWDAYLAARRRLIGATMNFAIKPAAMLQMHAASSTLVHVPVAETSRLANGTASADVPFAV